METVFQVNFNMLTHDEATRTEKVVREYLLQICDQVCMQVKGTGEYSLLAWPFQFRARRFEKTLSKEDIASQSDEYVTFNLTEKIKNYLNETTLFFTGSGKFFQGLSNPKFLQRGNEMSYLISDEKILNLYIPDQDKAELSNKGAVLDRNPEI